MVLSTERPTNHHRYIYLFQPLLLVSVLVSCPYSLRISGDAGLIEQGKKPLSHQKPTRIVELKFMFSTFENPSLKAKERVINMERRDEMYSRGNSERFEQRNALTVGLIKLTKQMKRVAFFDKFPSVLKRLPILTLRSGLVTASVS